MRQKLERERDIMKRRIAAACILALLACLATPSARAESATDWPSRQVTFVLPFAPGGAIDIYARAYAQKLSDKFGKPFVVENRPGAGTVLAAHSVARAAPDGHTILVSPSPLAINATLYKKRPYDTASDFIALAYVADIPLVLVVHPSLPVHSIPDLIRYAKDNPGKLSYASSGTGTTLHLSGEMLKSMTGITMTHIPYKGGPPALNDVVAGHVQLVFADPSSAIQQIRAGRVRPLGLTSTVRLPSAPDIPPIAEAGVPGFAAVSWTVFMAPANTPEPVAARLHAELTALAATPEMREQTIKLGMIPVTSPSLAELRGFLPREIGRWGKLVQQAGIAGSE
jgi:tripartite-type tricarboxylate transporter receptor subunit TctC